MKKRNVLMIASMSLLIFGCKENISSGNQASVATPSVVAEQPATTPPSASQKLEQKLAKDMPYADLRKIILAAGWLPLKTQSCRENMGDSGLICLQIPELDACSSDGHCVMWFADDASLTKIRINTYGDYRHWDVAGRESELGIQSWEFSPIVVATNFIACPSQKFEEFLKKYSEDESVRMAFTTPLVKVKDLIDKDDQGYIESLTYVPKEEYKAFYPVYKNDGFHIDSSPKVVSLDVQQEAEGTYLVKVPFGTEGASYRFRNQNGCWYLIEDPEPAAP